MGVRDLRSEIAQLLGERSPVWDRDDFDPNFDYTKTVGRIADELASKFDLKRRKKRFEVPAPGHVWRRRDGGAEVRITRVMTGNKGLTIGVSWLPLEGKLFEGTCSYETLLYNYDFVSTGLTTDP